MEERSEMVKNIFICIVISCVIICAFILHRIFNNRRTISRIDEGIGAADGHNQSAQRTVDDAKECGRVLEEGSKDLVDNSRELAEESRILSETSRKLSEDSEQIAGTVGNISDGIKELSGSVERSKKILEQIGKQRVD